MLKNLMLVRYLEVFLFSLILVSCGGSGGSEPPNENTTSLSTPQNLTLITSDAQLTLSWSAVSGATSYNIHWNTSGAVTTADTLINVTNTTYTHSALNNGSRYYYIIVALDDTRQSTASEEVSEIPQAQSSSLPAPNNLQAVADDGQINLSWEAVSGANSYNIYWNTTGNVTTEDTPITSVTTPYVHTGLSNGTRYYYIVTAVNNTLGESSSSNESSATPVTTSSGVIPAAPLITAQNQDGEITLSWEPIAEAAFYQIIIEYFPNITTPSLRSVKAYGIVQSAAPQTVFSSGIKGQPYYFVVRAANAAGEYGPLSNELTETPLAATALPSVPLLNNSVSNNGQVTVSWDAVANATAYNIYTSSSPTLSVDNYANLTDGTMQTVTSTTHVATNLVNSTDYYFLVTAVNGAGESEPSLTLIAQPSKGTWFNSPREPKAYKVFVAGERFGLSRTNDTGFTNLILSQYISSSDSWMKMLFADTQLAPIQRFDSVHVVNEKILIFNNNFVFELDPNNQRVIVKSALPTTRTRYVGAEINGKIALFGGRTGQGANLDLVDIYDPGNNTWVSGKPMPFATFKDNIVRNVIDTSFYISKAYTSEFYQYDLVNDAWITRPAVPVSRIDGRASCVVGSKLYVIGGVSTLASSAMYEYDATSNAWITATSLPHRRAKHACLVNNNKIYVLGGDIAAGEGTVTETAAMDVFDVASNSWGGGTRAPFTIYTANSSNNAAEVSSDIIELNGQIRYRGYQGTLQKYTIASNTWESPIKNDRNDTGNYQTSCSASFGSDIFYAMTKVSSSIADFISEIVKYDTLLNTWSIEYSTPYVDNGFPPICIPSGDKIYFIGSTGVAVLEYDTVLKTMATKGIAPVTSDPIPSLLPPLRGSAINGTLYTIHWGTTASVTGDRFLITKKYNPTSDLFSGMPLMPGWRVEFTTSAVNGILYVMGGKNTRSPFNTYQSVLAFDPVNNTWSPMADMPTASENLHSTVMNGKIYVMGGENSSNLGINAAEEFNPVTNTWEKLASLPEYFFGANVSASSNGKLYIEKDGKITEFDPGN